MLKYQNKGTVIEINLPTNKDYSVECRYKYIKEQDKYSLSMWLRRNDVDDLFKIDSQEIDTQIITSTKDTVRNDICKIVEFAANNGFFAPFIERYEYTYNCFNVGNEIAEKLRVGA